jgi:hypothetical protein
MAKAVRPTGLLVPTIGMTSAVEESASASPSPIAPAQPHEVKGEADDQTRKEQLRRAEAEDELAHAPQAPERKLEPDREQQQHDSKFGEWLDRVRVGYGDVIEPRRLLDHRSEPGRADKHADEDEADHRIDPEARKGGDDEPRRAKDHQRVRKACGFER